MKTGVAAATWQERRTDLKVCPYGGVVGLVPEPDYPGPATSATSL